MLCFGAVSKPASLPTVEKVFVSLMLPVPCLIQIPCKLISINFELLIVLLTGPVACPTPPKTVSLPNTIPYPHSSITTLSNALFVISSLLDTAYEKLETLIFSKTLSRAGSILLAGIVMSSSPPNKIPI